MKNTPLRTPEMFARYQAKEPCEGCFICAAEPLEEFDHWKIIWNDYPYDAVANRHYMLVPLKHVATRATLPPQASKELQAIPRHPRASKTLRLHYGKLHIGPFAADTLSSAPIAVEESKIAMSRVFAGSGKNPPVYSRSF